MVKRILALSLLMVGLIGVQGCGSGDVGGATDEMTQAQADKFCDSGIQAFCDLLDGIGIKKPSTIGEAATGIINKNN